MSMTQTSHDVNFQVSTYSRVEKKKKKSNIVKKRIQNKNENNLYINHFKAKNKGNHIPTTLQKQKLIPTNISKDFSFCYEHSHTHYLDLTMGKLVFQRQHGEEGTRRFLKFCYALSIGGQKSIEGNGQVMLDKASLIGKT